MIRSYLIPNWMRRLWHKITRKPDEQLEEWERLEYRKLKLTDEQNKNGAAS